MTLFWLVVAILIIICLVVLARPLFRQTSLHQDDRTRQNIQIAKERLRELEQELQEKTLAQTEYEQLREEVEIGLVDDLAQDPSKSMEPGSHINRRYIWALLTSIPIISIALYFTLGNPEMITLQPQTKVAGKENPHASSKNKQAGSMQEMVAKLAQRLETEPNNGEGWYMLGRSYLSLGDFTQAANALEKAHQLLGDDPGLLLRYADALTMSRNGKMSGKPFELVKKALTLRPNDPTGLWLAGMGYEENGEYRKAVQSWQKLLPLLKDEQSQQKVSGLIKRANSQLGDNPVEMSETVVAANEGIPVSVDIAAAVKDKIPADTTVFIFARAQSGSRMPLAVVRKQVKDLPIDVTLDDAMAMTEAMRISQFDKVNIVARVSFSGSAMAQPGDYQSEIQLAKPGQKSSVKLLIKNQLP